MNATATTLLGIFGVGALGWASWVSVQLYQIHSAITSSEARQDSQLADHEERLNDLERLFPRSIPTPR